jgi:hypothetical protein
LIELAVRQLVLAHPAVVQAGAKVYPLRVPQDGTYPNVVFTRVSAVHHTSLTAPSGLVQARIQLDFRARDYDTAKLLASAVSAPLAGGGIQGYAGQVLGYTIQGMHLVGDQETDESPYAADDLPVFRIQHDYHVWYGE